MRVGVNQQRALKAVAEGCVQHVHPFSWALPLELYDVMPYARWFRVLQSLTQRRLIRVEADSKEWQRPVHITEAGLTVLRDHSAGP